MQKQGLQHVETDRQAPLGILPQNKYDYACQYEHAAQSTKLSYERYTNSSDLSLRPLGEPAKSTHTHITNTCVLLSEDKEYNNLC